MHVYTPRSKLDHLVHVYTPRSKLDHLVYVYTPRSKLDHLVHVYTPRSKLDHLVYVCTPRKTKVRFIILPNKQVQQETTTFQMSDIFSLVAVSQVLCNHSNRVSITQKSVPPFSK